MAWGQEGRSGGKGIRGNMRFGGVEGKEMGGKGRQGHTREYEGWRGRRWEGRGGREGGCGRDVDVLGAGREGRKRQDGRGARAVEASRANKVNTSISFPTLKPPPTAHP